MLVILGLAFGFLGSPVSAQDHADHADRGKHEMHEMHEMPQSTVHEAAAVDLGAIPDTPLVDHTGRSVRFRSDLVDGHVVAINFLFTTCTTICPVQGALFADLQRQMAARAEPYDTGPPVRYLSVSIDPAVDTPERLAEWASRFGEVPGWTLLTGAKPDVDHLLKELGVFSALKEDHGPVLLLGNAATGTWRRASALAPPDQIVPLLDELVRPAPSEPLVGDAASREYFTDTRLLDQHGREHRFYSDLIAGRTVVINSFFADCDGSCPIMHSTVTKIQDMLGERLGRDVFLLSLSVDPERDTPARLAAYAERFGARDGWYFLTGRRDDVEIVLGKLGQRVNARESHKSIFLVGNDATGLWKKAFALAPPAEVLAVVRSVVDDGGEAAARSEGSATAGASASSPDD